MHPSLSLSGFIQSPGISGIVCKEQMLCQRMLTVLWYYWGCNERWIHSIGRHSVRWLCSLLRFTCTPPSLHAGPHCTILLCSATPRNWELCLLFLQRPSLTVWFPYQPQVDASISHLGAAKPYCEEASSWTEV